MKIMDKKIKEQLWLFIRDGEVRAVFENRIKAIEYFKELLKQTLQDFEDQDKNNVFDYSIIIPRTEIKPVEKREPYLSLL